MNKLYPWVDTFFKSVWTALVSIITAPFKAVAWLWRWWRTKPTYKITVSYDADFGNKDDVVYENVPVITKQTWKELNFVTAQKKAVNIRANCGLNYRIEEE